MVTFPHDAPNAGAAPHPVLERFYHRPDERQAVVNGLFDDASPSYDRITSLMSFGTGGWYRRDALRRWGVGPGSRVLDVASGTGQVAAAAMRLSGPEGLVLGVDPSAGMRRVAAQRGCRVVEGTAERLPVDDASFDLVVMGYALRHVSDLVAAFAEMRRALRPGGRVLILEVTRPESNAARWLLRLYLRGVVPMASLLLTANRRAMELMRYYWESIDRCVPPGAILSAMERSGLRDAAVRRSMGVLTEYTAER